MFIQVILGNFFQVLRAWHTVLSFTYKHRNCTYKAFFLLLSVYSVSVQHMLDSKVLPSLTETILMVPKQKK